MKAQYFIAPVLAVVGVMSLYSYDYRVLNELKERRVTLVEAIDRGEAEVARDSPARKKESWKTADGEVDWLVLAQKISEMEGRGPEGDFREFIAIQKMLMGMNEEELMTALRKIKELDISDRVKNQLAEGLLEMLAQKNPELAIKLFSPGGEWESSASRWRLASSFSQWLAKDPQSAMKWLDEQIAAGHLEPKDLDGRDSPREALERTVIQHLMKTDPRAVAARMSKMDEADRDRILRSLRWQVTRRNKENIPQLIALVEEFASEDRREDLITDIIGDGGLGFQEGLDLLNGVELSDESIREVRRNLLTSEMTRAEKPEEITAALDLARAADPEADLRRAGYQIARLVEKNRMTMDEAFALTQPYHEKGGDESLMMGLFTRLAGQEGIENYASQLTAGEEILEGLRADVKEKFDANRAEGIEFVPANPE